MKAIIILIWMMSGAVQASDGALTHTVENDIFSSSDNNYR